MTDTRELNLRWIRPANVPFPTVWHKFEAVTKEGQRLPIRIQDLTPDRHDEVWELYKTDFYPDESIMRSVRTLEDEETMTSQEWLVHQIMRMDMSLIAVLDNDEPKPTIVANQLLYVFSKGDQPFPTLPGASRRKFIEYFSALCTGIDPFERLDTDACIKDNGLVVKREFRRLKIGSHMLTALENMAKTFSIRAAVIVFNNFRSIEMAKKCGFNLFRELDFGDFVDEQGQIILPVDDTKAAAYMYKKYF